MENTTKQYEEPFAMDSNDASKRSQESLLSFSPPDVFITQASLYFYILKFVFLLIKSNEFFKIFAEKIKPTLNEKQSDKTFYLPLIDKVKINANKLI